MVGQRLRQRRRLTEPIAEQVFGGLDVDRLLLSPQCGFASLMAGNQLGWDDQRCKLELVVGTARKVWG